MSDRATTLPIVDLFDIWAGYTHADELGHVVSQDRPAEIRLAVQPVRLSEPFFEREEPWEASSLNRVALRYEGGIYRMWYAAFPDPEDPRIPASHEPGSSLNPEFSCYAESTDGWHWKRPELGLTEYDGTRANNIICDAGVYAFHSVFEDPKAAEQERYRAINTGAQFVDDEEVIPKREFRERRRKLQEIGDLTPEDVARFQMRCFVRAAASADGINWQYDENPLAYVEGNLDTQSVAVYDAPTDRYLLFLRGHVGRRRSVRMMEAMQFSGPWSPPRMVLQVDPQDDMDADLYTSAYSAYPGIPGFHLQFPSVYHRSTGYLDIQLATSRDTLNWCRPERRPIVVRERADGGEYGSIYAAPSMVPLDAETWGLAVYAYHHDHSGSSSGEAGDGELCWARWKRDRLVALEAPVEGYCTLLTPVCASNVLRLNYQTDPGGWIRCELVREVPNRGGYSEPAPIPGFEFDNCSPLAGDQLDEIVSWKSGPDLAALKGLSFAVRVHMFRAKLFAISV